ncbi:MAG: hypothetical protein GY739_12600, partial [Mesoflavibacter sp.]|nr:hypothetical protein [Mesoflavibacter sp.]
YRSCDFYRQARQMLLLPRSRLPKLAQLRQKIFYRSCDFAAVAGRFYRQARQNVAFAAQSLAETSPTSVKFSTAAAILPQSPAAFTGKPGKMSLLPQSRVDFGEM